MNGWNPTGAKLEEGDRYTFAGVYEKQFFLWRWLWPTKKLCVFIAHDMNVRESAEQPLCPPAEVESRQ